MARFAGFGPNALPFFKGLAFHQNRDWFEENRAIYEAEARQPMIALIEDLAEAFAAAKVPLTGDGKRSIFRLNRDIRFSKDKSPYKTHMGAVMTRSGDKKDQGLLYMHFDPEGCFVAAGFYMPEPPQLLALRNSIKRKPKQFDAMVAALAKGKLALSEEHLMTRLPRGFEEFKGGPLDGPLRLKSFIVHEAVSDKDVLKSAFAKKVSDFAVRSRPLLEFGWTALV